MKDHAQLKLPPKALARWQTAQQQLLSGQNAPALVAYQALRHPWLSRPVQLYGHYITPLILITVGMFVLSNTALDLLPGT